MTGGRRAAAVALATLLGAGCSEVRDRLLPLPLPLSYQGGLLHAHGAPGDDPAAACDEAARPEPLGRLLIDAGTPLSAFRGAPGEPPLRFPKGQVLVAGDEGGAAGAARLLLCDAAIVRTGQGAEDFSVKWGPNEWSISVVLGGDLLARHALLFSFAQEPSEPLCQRPPCVRFGRSDLATNCRLADRGEAVLPFRASGGELLVELGDNIIALQPTRITAAACLEPPADPLAGHAPAPCLSCARIEERRAALAVDPRGGCRLTQLNDLYNLVCNPTPARACPTPDFRLPPAVSPPPGCPVLSLEDLIEAEALHEPGYRAGGLNVRLLVSTALPGLVLSETAYRNLRGDAALREVQRQTAEIRMPGFTVPDAHPASLGREGLPALALLSDERHLSPCEELARSRRQRYGLPRIVTDSAGNVECRQDRGHGREACMQAACLVNLARDPTQQQRRCAFSGQRPELACDDLRAPVAAVVEVDGPLGDVMVVPDSAPLLRSVNAELRGTSAQVDGIIGVSVLARLQVEIDYPQGRIIAHCRCGGAGCRTYRRVTYDDADECGPPLSLPCLPDSGGAVPPLACR